MYVGIYVFYYGSSASPMTYAYTAIVHSMSAYKLRVRIKHTTDGSGHLPETIHRS